MKKKFEEMNSYDKLVAEHNYKVEALQRDCPHVDSEWITIYYMGVVLMMPECAKIVTRN
jgi:hypothetical protein